MAARTTFAQQKFLPRLPVPDLRTTVERFLLSAKPLLSSQEHATITEQAELFLSDKGLGATLQKRLQDRASTMDSSKPVLQSQVSRAAALISGCMAFRDMLVSESLPPETMRGGQALCMRMYRFMFNCCRVPAPEEDVTKLHPHDNTRVLVLCKNQLFLLDTDPMGQRCTVEQIESLLKRIRADASTTPQPHSVGVLTSAHRDDLAMYYKRLVGAHPTNKASLREIEECAFAVCLDDASPTSHTDVAKALLHGGANNRWYDKPLQFIVFGNGKAGFIGEHSAMDGMPTAFMANWVLDGIEKGRLAVRGQAASTHDVPAATRLPFVITDEVAADIASATKAHAQAIADHEVGTLVYESYGKDQAKKFKVSPDAYAQMAIQLAYYSMFGEVRATYEPAHTRKFLCGRTECIRVVSSESKQWVEAMRDESSNPQERVALLRTAAAAHSARTKLCANAQGVDRHLFGLRMLRLPGEACPLFDNPAFYRTSHWSISTSNLTSEYFENWGWGEVVSDGIGVAYSTQKNAFRFNVTGRAGVGALQFCDTLRRCLNDMRDAFVASAGIRSKL